MLIFTTMIPTICRQYGYKTKLRTAHITSLMLWTNTMVIYSSITHGCLKECKRKKEKEPGTQNTGLWLDTNWEYNFKLNDLIKFWKSDISCLIIILNINAILYYGICDSRIVPQDRFLFDVPCISHTYL